MSGSLRHFLERLPDNTPILRDDSSELTVATLLSTLTEETAGRLRDQALAVWARSPARLARWLVMLDGLCAQLLVIPADTSPADVTSFLERSRSRVLLTDQDPGQCRLPSGTEVLAEPEPGAPESASAGLGREPRVTAWILATSGTTGTPKLVSHTLASLTESTKQDPAKGRAYVWGLLYDMARFAGLQVFFQSLLGGSTLLTTDPLASLHCRLDQLRAGGCNCLSATPTMWRRILMTPDAEDLRLRQITLGGEIADAAVLKALAKSYPAARIVHIYASTEAGVGFAVTDGRAGFPAAFLEDAPPGVALEVRDGLLFARRIRHAPRYVGSDESLSGPDGFIDTGDVVRILDDRVYFMGRADGRINVGGDKVYPEDVESVLLDHPAVRFARVGAKASPITGSVVRAEVVVEGGAADDPALERELRRFCRERLEAFKVPAILTFVTNIDMDQTGKIGRESR